jgi:hypothetical protein
LDCGKIKVSKKHRKEFFMSDLLLNVGSYSKLFLNGGGRVNPRYYRPVSERDYIEVAKLGGDNTAVDTPLEIAILSSCAGAIDVRPVDAVKMLPADDPKLADLKLGAAVYMDMQAAKFLGSDPAPYATALKFITDRGRVTEANIKDFVKQGIAETVDAEFNKVRGFMLDRKYNVVLTRNAQNHYILSYERPSVENDDKKLSAVSLDALLSAMRSSGDFSQSAIDIVREQAALIPAVVFDGWKRSTPNMVNPYELLTKALTDFYTTPNTTNYKVLLGIEARAGLGIITGGDEFTSSMLRSISRTVIALSPELFANIDRDLNTDNKIIAAANIPDDPQYGIFTLTRAAGDEIFVSKRRSAPGLLE